MLIRSVTDFKWGEVYLPGRSPNARSRASTIRAIDVLPLVPVMWMVG